MGQPRSCDLYNVPEEDCECNTWCGTTHESCPEHSEQALTSWQSQSLIPSNNHNADSRLEHSKQTLTSWNSQPSTPRNTLNADFRSENSTPPSIPTKESFSDTSLIKEHEESAAEILEKYDKYNEFMSICLALSTSSLTSALQDYRGFVLQCSFWRSDEPVIREFHRILELANSQSYVEEVDVYKMAEMTAGDPWEGNSSSTWRTYLAARKYRMLVQWSGGKFGVDQDILKAIESLLEIWKPRRET